MRIFLWVQAILGCISSIGILVTLAKNETIVYTPQESAIRLFITMCFIIWAFILLF